MSKKKTASLKVSGDDVKSILQNSVNVMKLVKMILLENKKLLIRNLDKVMVE